MGTSESVGTGVHFSVFTAISIPQKHPGLYQLLPTANGPPHTFYRSPLNTPFGNTTVGGENPFHPSLVHGVHGVMGRTKGLKARPSIWSPRSGIMSKDS